MQVHTQPSRPHAPVLAYLRAWHLDRSSCVMAFEWPSTNEAERSRGLYASYATTALEVVLGVKTPYIACSMDYGCVSTTPFAKLTRFLCK